MLMYTIELTLNDNMVINHYVHAHFTYTIIWCASPYHGIQHYNIYFQLWPSSFMLFLPGNKAKLPELDFQTLGLIAICNIRHKSNLLSRSSNLSIKWHWLNIYCNHNTHYRFNDGDHSDIHPLNLKEEYLNFIILPITGRRGIKPYRGRWGLEWRSTRHDILLIVFHKLW